MTIHLDLKILSDSYEVNFDTGDVKWKDQRPLHHFGSVGAHKCWTTKYANKPTGSLKFTKGMFYRVLTISHVNFGRKLSFSEHRVIYALFHNDSCPPEIDHYDGNPLNNSISNLRPCTGFVNSRNTKKRSDNKTGISGISWDNNKCRWIIQIGVLEKQKRVTSNADFFEACCTRKRWELELDYSPRHGV